MKGLWMFLALFAFCVPSAYAIDEGTAQGTLVINDEKIALTHSYAHFHDNAEGLLDRPKELRIVLSDREIPHHSLRGIVFLPVENMAREGRVRGLIMKLDPNNRNKVVVTLLTQPSKPGLSLMTLTLSVTGQPLFKKLLLSNVRVAGEVEHADTRDGGGQDLPKLAYAAKFSAPLFNELPVTSNLKGKAAQNSPQVKAYREKINALKKGDFEAVKRLSSESANRRDAAMLARLDDQTKKAFAAEAAADMEQSLKKIKRVVVRGESAVVIFSESHWATFVREGGQWKSGD
ncbi:MAG: hypothetical protein CVU61_11760 [Deltaproteobacteria bacterium HGW-Deltaproteobacteria-19]|jgi:hypothetical protein|nr:MAG: hypothetical protein CVU61_11760 [Deltaproteobacteria bacterium HGW-Deltaproteobacteria-19]